MRGDVPGYVITSPVNVTFSPHARGCSVRSCILPGEFSVFPACAGMFHHFLAWQTAAWSFPRMRGDVPGGPWGGHTTGKFSPHARGCSARM